MEYNNILIIDDSETSRMITKRCFEIAGFNNSTYYEAEDGLQALKILATTKIDLILTDINMPKMDGITFIKKIKTHDVLKNIKLVIISSLADNPEIIKLKEDKDIIFIKKPISPQKILESFNS